MAFSDLPEWQASRIVRAAKISRMEVTSRGSCRFHFVDPDIPPIVKPVEWMTRHLMGDGDWAGCYLVVDEIGAHLVDGTTFERQYILLARPDEEEEESGGKK